MCNHGSIGHLGSWILARNLALGVSALFLSLFSFSAVWKRWRHKDLVDNQEGELHVFQFMVSFLLLLFFCWWQFRTLFRHCLIQWPFCIFFFCFLPIFDQEFFFFFFFCFPPIFDRGFSLFLFLLRHIHNLTVNEAFSSSRFFEILLFFFFSRIRVKIPTLGRGLGPKDWGFGPKRLCRRQDMTYVRVLALASSSGIKGNAPHYFHDTHITTMIYKIMQNWSCMHPCGQSSFKFVVT